MSGPIASKFHLRLLDLQALADHLQTPQGGHAEDKIHVFRSEEDPGRIKVSNDHLGEFESDLGDDFQMGLAHLDFSTDLLFHLRQDEFLGIVWIGEERKGRHDHDEEKDGKETQKQGPRTNSHSPSERGARRNSLLS